jgi:uncharacterized protein YbjT (DUF2867 family)
MPRTALIAGASGLVGSACLARLLAEPSYARVVALARRLLPVTHPKLETLVVDFARPEQLRAVPHDDAFCALGTTMARAGSREAFRAVDYLAVLALADLAIEGGARQFVLVSSVGADATSGNFYLRVKGEAEAAVAKRPFEAVHVLRPSLLLGDRQESRPGEAMARAVVPWLNPLLIGPARIYRALAAGTVGAAMVGAALMGARAIATGEPSRRTRILHYDEIIAAAAHV